MTWRTVAAGGGFALALIGSFTSWVSAGGRSFSAFEDNAQFRVGDWLGNDSIPIDGLLALALACGGLAVVWALAAGRIPERRGPMFVRELGSVTMALGILEMQFISSVSSGGADWGFGLYLMVVGGALATFSPFFPNRSLQTAR